MPYIGNVLTSFAVETGNITDQAVTAPKLSATGGTDGQVLALDSGGNLVWSSDPAGQWVTSGDNIFYNTGDVGIGTTTPGSILHIRKDSTNNTPLSNDWPAVQSGLFVDNQQTGTTGAFSAVTLRAHNSDSVAQAASIIAQSVGGSGLSPSLLFTQRTASGVNSERMRIDSNGHLLIGDVTGPQTSAQSILQLIHAEGPNLTFARDDTTVTTNDDIGLIRFYTNDSDGTYEECARIAVEAESAHSDTSKPTYIRLMTTPVDGTAPTEKFRVTSSGRIGIGEADPQATVQIAQDSGLDGVRISVADTSGVSNVFRIRNSTDTSTFGMIKYDLDASRMIFNRGGDVAGFTSDGLTFGSDTAAANALDDYEEGTFTPEFADAASGGNASGSYATRVGRYVKIGRQVTINLYIDNADTTGLSAGNAAWIRGLPAAIAVDNGIIQIGVVGLSNINVDSTAYGAYAFANATSASQTGFRMLQMRDALAHQTLNVSNFPDADNEIFVSMSYLSV